MAEQDQSTTTGCRETLFNWGWISIGVLIAFALLVVGLSDARDLFSHQTTSQPLTDQLSVHISRPNPLPIFAEPVDRLPLLIWITGDVPTTTIASDSALYVTVREPWLAVLRADGQPLGSAPLAVGSAINQLGGSFFLAPTDIVTPMQPAAHLSVTVVDAGMPLSFSTSTGTLPFAVTNQLPKIEFDVDLDNSTFLPFFPLPLLFLAQEFIKLADAIALLVAVLFGVYQLRKWREEGVQREDDRRRDEVRWRQEDRRQTEQRRREDDRRRDEDRRHVEERQRAEDRQRKEDRQREEERRRDEVRRREEERRRESERVRMMRHRRIDVTETLLGQSWVDGVVDLASMTDQSQREKWESELGERSQNLAQRHCGPSQQGEFLRRVGTRYRQDRDVVGLRGQLHGARCFSQDIFTKIEPCIRVIDNPTAEIDSLVQVFVLWDHHSYDAWDVIAAIFCHVHKSNPERAKKIITEQLRYDADKPQDDADKLDKVERKWLGLHPNLREFVEPFPPHLYSWPPLKIPPSDSRALSDPAFLAAHSFLADPFASISESANEKGIMLSQRWLQLPEQLRSQSTRGSSFIRTHSFDDGLAIAMAILQDMQRDFPIAGVGDYLDGNLSGNWALSELFCRIAADWWLRLIGINSNGFLALSPENQGMIFDLLLWFCGSDAVLTRMLGLAQEAPGEAEVTPAERSDGHEAKLDQDRIRKARRLLGAYLQYLMAQRKRIDHPTTIQLIEWLSIRPPGRDGDTDVTVMLVVLPPSMSEVVLPGIESLIQKLSERRVYFHLFSDNGTIKGINGLRVVDLTWTPDELRNMIDGRIGAFSDLNSFVDLTDPRAFGAIYSYEYLLAVASGSLDRALRFCRVAIRRQQELTTPPHAPLLSEYVLRTTRDEFNRGNF